MSTICVICGGPSKERGISLNSARSIWDHLSTPDIAIQVFYVDGHIRFYELSEKDLYSNTPSDFDFKLQNPLPLEEVIQRLKKVDLVFPVIHGPFGEDGTLQGLLEKHQIPFAFSGKRSCEKMYPKHIFKKVLKENHFPVLPYQVIETIDDCLSFFSKYPKAIVKPSHGGSSIGVSLTTCPNQAFHLAESLHQPVLLELFCTGSEFTIIVLENDGNPFALTPTEIEVTDEGTILDFRKKYLPTNQVIYHTPPRFSKEMTQHIQRKAEELFTLFEMRDAARLDGFLAPDGTIYFIDCNPISGFEQNSFFFRQASLHGLNHHEALFHIVTSAADRFNLKMPQKINPENSSKTPVFVLFGGQSAERQVSLMSGTNVWLKLTQSDRFTPTPYFYDGEGLIRKLTLTVALNHTVEEIHHNCLEENIPPLSIDAFLEIAQKEKAFLFIALHGGIGENGSLQKQLEKWQIPYNGSSSLTSALCMDKYATGKVIENLHHQDLSSSPKQIVNRKAPLWKADFAYPLVIKPRQDGCSSGVVVLQEEEELKTYFDLVKRNALFIPKGIFSNQQEIVHLPDSEEYLLEPYVEVDTIEIDNNQLRHIPKQGWIELTIGILEDKGHYRALNPSISIASQGILSLEEKFQGGTGVNLTPPPPEILSLYKVEKIKALSCLAALALHIQAYARIDLFFNIHTEKMILIEVNTLPGLTPSTVLYHQGLAEDPPLSPLSLLEELITRSQVCERELFS